MESAHREWRNEMRQAQADLAREMRHFRDEMRSAGRSFRSNWR
jgi:hypothetical protein